MNDKSPGSRPWVIGIDFDNTLSIYDELVHHLALERGLIDPQVDKSKKVIRDTVRGLPDGETEWQKLQGLAYGPRMDEATLSEGVPLFFKTCRRHDAELRIISHKTEFAEHDETRTNLRQAALNWMTKHDFFDPAGLGLSRRDVFFAGTREEKLDLIQRLGCTHFIDDLEEVFQEEHFPPEVCKILFDPHLGSTGPPGVIVASSWREITDRLFQDRE